MTARIHFGINLPVEQLRSLDLGPHTKKDYVWFTQTNLKIRAFRHYGTSLAPHFYDIDDLAAGRTMDWVEEAQRNLDGVDFLPPDWDGYMLYDNETLPPIGEYWGTWGQTQSADSIEDPEEIERITDIVQPAMIVFLEMMKKKYPKAKHAWYHLPGCSFVTKSRRGLERVDGEEEKLAPLLEYQDFIDVHSYQVNESIADQDTDEGKYDYHYKNIRRIQEYARSLGKQAIPSFWLQGTSSDGTAGAHGPRTLEIWFTACRDLGITDAVIFAGRNQLLDMFVPLSGLSIEEFWQQRVVQPALDSGYLNSNVPDNQPQRPLQSSAVLPRQLTTDLLPQRRASNNHPPRNGPLSSSGLL
tara:strand:- start:486185 stop:487252 length:1068 start_codon:yes stop_codon:yes gene_type:complete